MPICLSFIKIPDCFNLPTASDGSRQWPPQFRRITFSLLDYKIWIKNATEMKGKKQMEAKVAMVGDVGVGKSSITVRYALSKFDNKMESTLGAAYMQKVYESTEGKPIKLKIWDTAGQEKYKAIAKLYYKDCQAAFIIFDVTRRQTFLNLGLWADELIKHSPKNILLVVVGNKIDLISAPECDLLQSEIVKKEQAQAYAKSINAAYYQVSAKSQIGVDQLFGETAQKLIAQFEKSTLSTRQQQCSKPPPNKLKNSFFEESGPKRRKKCCEHS